MNTCYKHFYYFVTEFNLVEKKELDALVSTAAELNGRQVAPLTVLLLSPMKCERNAVTFVFFTPVLNTEESLSVHCCITFRRCVD